MECHSCGCTINDDEPTYELDDGNTYCRDCVFSCDRCGNNYEQSEITITNNDQSICTRCYETYYFKCDDCGQVFDAEEANDFSDNNKTVCDECFEENYHRCYQCGRNFVDDEGAWSSGTWYCTECAGETTQCIECGESMIECDGLLVYNNLEDAARHQNPIGRICSECHITKRFKPREKVDWFSYADSIVWILKWPQQDIPVNTRFKTIMQPNLELIPKDHGVTFRVTVKLAKVIQEATSNVDLNLLKHWEPYINEQDWNVELHKIAESITKTNAGQVPQIFYQYFSEGDICYLEIAIKRQKATFTINGKEFNNNMRRCIFGHDTEDSDINYSAYVDICNDCIYGQLCEECKMYAHRPACPICMKKYANRKNELETKLFILENQANTHDYHSNASCNRFIKNLKYRMPNEHPYMYYGIELEMRINYNNSITSFVKEMVKAGKGLFVAERDGSVSNGYEFISRPTSNAAWHSKEVQEILVNMNKVAEKYGYNQIDQDGAGMHVHMSKIFFRKNTKKDMQEQMDDMAWIIEFFRKDLYPIFGRGRTDYNLSTIDIAIKRIRDEVYYRDNGVKVTKVKLEKGHIIDNHRMMITKGAEGRTIEVRAFAGTNDPTTIMARIEFLSKIANFVRSKNINGKTLNKIIGKLDNVPALKAFIESKKIEFDEKKKISNDIEVEL